MHICNASESSKIMLYRTNKDQSKLTCYLEKIASLTEWVFGQSTGNSVAFTHYISGSSRIQFKLPLTFKDLEHPVCRVSEEEWVYSTPYGLLFSFEFVNSQHPLVNFAISNKLDTQGSNNSVYTSLLSKYKVHSRVSRSYRHHLHPIKLSKLNIRNRRSADIIVSSDPDSSIYSIPAEFRSGWLFQHLLWETASNEWNFNVLKNATLEFNNQF